MSPFDLPDLAHDILTPEQRQALDARCEEIARNIIERHEDRDRYCRQRIFRARLEARDRQSPQSGAPHAEVQAEDDHDHQSELHLSSGPNPSRARRSVADPAGTDLAVTPACAIGASLDHEPEVGHLMDDFDPISDLAMRNFDMLDPWTRDAELQASVVTIPAPPGGPVTITRTDEPVFSRPSAVVS